MNAVATLPGASSRSAEGAQAAPTLTLNERSIESDAPVTSGATGRTAPSSKPRRVPGRFVGGSFSVRIEEQREGHDRGTGPLPNLVTPV